MLSSIHFLIARDAALRDCPFLKPEGQVGLLKKSKKKDIGHVLDPCRAYIIAATANLTSHVVTIDEFPNCNLISLVHTVAIFFTEFAFIAQFIVLCQGWRNALG